MANELVYLSRRASEERVAAQACLHSRARGVHLELAQAYEFRLLLLKQLATQTTGHSPGPLDGNAVTPSTLPSDGAASIVSTPDPFMLVTRV